MYSGGFIRGSKIEMIKPDFHRIIGWNRGHKLDDYDFTELNDRGITKKVREIENKTHKRIDYLIKTNQKDLIGKNIFLPELEEKPKIDSRLETITNNLVNKFKV